MANPIIIAGIPIVPIKLSVPRKINSSAQPTQNVKSGSLLSQQTKTSARPKQVTFSDLPNHPSRVRSSGSLGQKIAEEVDKLSYSTRIDYKVNDRLASAYLKDQKDRKIGTLGNLPKTKLDLDALQDIVKRSKYDTKLTVYTICGAPGSAKSTFIRNLALKLGAFDASCSITVICPRAEQRKDWERLTNLHHTKDYLIKTFETPFYQPCAECVIIEECGQMPPGWLDALLKASPHIKYVFILGDSEQNFHYVSNNSAMTFGELNCFEQILQNNEVNYKAESYRLSEPQCKIPGKEITCLSGVKDFPIKEVKKFSDKLPVLTTSESRQRRLADQGYRENYSFQSCQGKDFKKEDGSYQVYQMELTKDCLNMEERVFYTAVTRSNAGINVKFEDEKARRALEEYSAEVPSLRFIFQQLHKETERRTYNIQKLKNSDQLRHLEYGRSWVAVQNHLELLRDKVRLSPKDYPKEQYPNFQFDFCKTTQFFQFSVHEYEALARSLGHEYPVYSKREPRRRKGPAFRQTQLSWTFY